MVVSLKTPSLLVELGISSDSDSTSNLIINSKIFESPEIFPQTTSCMANVHTLLLCTLLRIQVTLVWLVVVGQLPQFDARML